MLCADRPANGLAAQPSSNGHTPSADPAKPDQPSKANGKPGARPGNEHALRTGLRSPKCPKAARGIDSMRYSFRRRAFADWKARNGSNEVPFFVECRIDTATRHHKNALLIEWLIRKGGDLPSIEFQALLDKASDYTDRRDKALREIGLATATNGNPHADLWAGLHSEPPSSAISSPSPASAPQTATQSPPALQTQELAPEKRTVASLAIDRSDP